MVHNVNCANVIASLSQTVHLPEKSLMCFVNDSVCSRGVAPTLTSVLLLILQRVKDKTHAHAHAHSSLAFTLLVDHTSLLLTNHHVQSYSEQHCQEQPK